MRASCLPEGPGYLYARGPDLNWAMSKIVQTPSLIVILHADLTYRQIFTDGRALEPDANPSWMGYSVGRWEGDTLVVESAGFNDRTWLEGGYPHTEGLRAVERATGLDLRTGELDAAATDATLEIERQVSQSDEVRSLVTALEEQYDAFSRNVGSTSLLAQATDLPTADELGAEFERFLAQQGDDPAGT